MGHLPAPLGNPVSCSLCHWRGLVGFLPPALQPCPGVPRPRQPHTCISFCLQNTIHCQPAMLPEPKLHPLQPKTLKASPPPKTLKASPPQRPSRQAPLQRPRVLPPFCVFLSKFAWFPFHSHPRSIICWSPYPQQLTGAHAHSTRSQLHPCLCSLLLPTPPPPQSKPICPMFVCLAGSSSCGLFPMQPGLLAPPWTSSRTVSSLLTLFKLKFGYMMAHQGEEG